MAVRMQDFGAYEQVAGPEAEGGRADATAEAVHAAFDNRDIAQQ